MVDTIIASMKAGQTAEISRVGNISCTVEISGDGKIVRFVRTNEISGMSVVYRTCKR